MKKNKVLDYIVRRKYYFSLLGCLLVIAISLGIIFREDSDYDELANLNEEITSGMSEGSVSKSGAVGELVENEPTAFIEEPEITISREYMPEDVYSSSVDDVLEEDESDEQVILSEGDAGDKEEEDNSEDTLKDEDAEQEQDDSVAVVEEEVAQVIPVIKVEQPNLTFEKESGIMMPLDGDILLDYSDAVPVYFETLNQYRVNEALYIVADEGAEVKAVAEGVIEKIEHTEKLGYQITIYHGNGYKSIYGQLQEDMNVREGEIIKKGRIIGYVSKVSNYYMLEGNHLYFQFIEDDKAINPSDLVK